MKKIILLLFAALALTACESNMPGDASHYGKPEYDVNGIQIVKPIREYRLGGHPSSIRYLLFYVFDGMLWYEYCLGGDAGGMRPYKKVHGDIEGIDFDAIVTEVVSDTTKTLTDGKEETSPDR